MGGRRGAVVKAACLEVGNRGFEPHSGLRDLKKQNVLPCSLVMIQYFGEPL